MQLNAPRHQESMPIRSSDSPTTPGDRFTPSPLSHMQIGLLRQSSARNRRRRRAFRASHLRVCITGEEWRWCDPTAGLSEPFKVPLTTPYLEIFGDDADGALLLAVFPLPDPASIEDDQAQCLWISLEAGQTVGVEISLGIGTFGVVSEYVVRMAYSESPER